MKLGTRILSLACVLTILLAGLGLTGSAAAAEEGELFTAEELQTRMVDRTFFMAGGKGKDKWRVYYYLNPDGTSLIRVWGEDWKFRASGTWRIEGNTICSAWSDLNLPKGCYEYFERGKYIVSRGVSGERIGEDSLQKDLGQGNVKNLK